MASARHPAWPFRVVDGVVVTVEQDSIEEIEQCVEAVVNTIVGSRIDAPEYGIPDESFKTQTASSSVSSYLAAIEAAEPRAHVIGEERLEEMVKHVTLRVGGRA